MPLVERLMGLNADGSPPGSAGPDRARIAVHSFFAAVHEVIVDRLTVAAMKTEFAMDTGEQAEFDDIMDLAPPGSSQANLTGKLFFVTDMHTVFILANDGHTGYSTPSGVRAKLGI